MKRIGVIGAGSFGVALSLHLNRMGHEVTLWSFAEEEYEWIKKHRNIGSKLPGIEIPEEILLTTDIAAASKEQDLILLAVPSVFIRNTAHSLAPFVKEGQIVATVAKGMEAKTKKRLSEVMEEELPQSSIVCLSGPSHAEEVAVFLPTCLVAGSKSEAVQDIFMSETLRVYTSPDLIGMEVGATVKNVIALAAGMSDGLGFGDNTKAALITRGIAETMRLGIAMGGQMKTLCGLTGIGDLVVTCASVHSRNRRCGMLIGQGEDPKKAVEKVGMVVEGVNAAPTVLELSRQYGVSMPITEQVNEVLFEGAEIKETMRRLMGREKRSESEEAQWEETD